MADVVSGLQSRPSNIFYCIECITSTYKFNLGRRFTRIYFFSVLISADLCQ
jgi:hypothetical protein